MKPLGIEPLISALMIVNKLSMTDKGFGMSVSQPSRVEDAVWNAVEEAIDSGWTPERFRSEVAEAWAEKLQDEIKHVRNVLS